jgi:carboxylesterase
MRYLGERLHRDTGFAVSGVMLAGHGTEASEFQRKGWPDWYRSAEQGLLELAETCSPLFVVGFSMGGAIAMALALRHAGTVRALALLAMPLFAHRHKARLAAVLYGLPGVRAWLCRRSKDSPWEEGAVRRKNLDAVQMSFAQLKWVLRRKGACLTQPLLILQSRRDPSVPWENALALNNLASSRRKRRVLLTRSRHVLPMDVERDRVADEIRQFFLSL